MRASSAAHPLASNRPQNGIFGVLFTLSKENSEIRIRVRWVLLKVALDAWQLFTTVISPEQGWDINAHGTAWKVASVLNFDWLADTGYGTYLGVLYGMVSMLAVNLGLCVWVAWCFKEQKFPVVWPIQVLRVFSSVFFQAFDVASLNLLQLGISCRYWGPATPHMRMDLFPQHSCAALPHVPHAVVSGCSLALFVAIGLFLNMAEVEVNPLSRRPLALGHSGAEVAAFAIKVLLTLVDVFIGGRRVAAVVSLLLSLLLAWQTIRWSPNLVSWVNHVKSGVYAAVVWSSAVLVVLVFRPGSPQDSELDGETHGSVSSEGAGGSQAVAWARGLTVVLLAGLPCALGAGAALSWARMRRTRAAAMRALAAAAPGSSLEDVFGELLESPRDVEIVARCCRVWVDRRTLSPDAVDVAHCVVQAGRSLFPRSAFVALFHANFMIEVLGVAHSGGRRVSDAAKLEPGLMCRFVMFVRQQQATQRAASHSSNEGASMDLLGYVEYQRKQRSVVRLHREALQAMCNFWRALDSHSVSFAQLSRALGRIESSVRAAQAAYRAALQSYGNSPNLVRLYGRFLLNIKNDPWGAAQYFETADRLEELRAGDANGPLLPDGTPLGRMDEMSTAVLVVNTAGEMQMANRQAHQLFGYKRGTLDGKPLSGLLAAHCGRWLAAKLADLAAAAPKSTSAPPPAGGGNGGGDLTSSTAPAPPVDPVSAARRLLAEAKAVKNPAAAAAAAGPSPPSAATGGGGGGGGGVSYPQYGAVLVGMHSDRVAFPVRVTLQKVSGVGEDSTIVAMLEPLAAARSTASLWATDGGLVTACDAGFAALFGWSAAEVAGANLAALLALEDDSGGAHEPPARSDGAPASGAFGGPSGRAGGPQHAFDPHPGFGAQRAAPSGQDIVRR
ncbi:hypothetical protein GPECTOR_16g569 [Gonium pectorale]|uniref:PAS domain-containing protein n=1 Tax=Gonium pectorale TaxID=33097 RepID=A0A150GKL5_GONPE|nr:hypothetical protein GPECTOR_16g569 [Gonium pectorale]|eukprot:KXZ50396.1 hypothetical protein GPECTOR_16g569 [Gonium pectorale]